VNKLLRHTIQPKGTVVRRISVAVILDNKAIYSKGKDGKTVERAEPRSQKDLDSYRDLVLAAVGFNEQRGDVVTIENVPFYSDFKPEEPQAAVPVYVKYQQYFVPGMKYLAFLIMFILAYILFVRPIRKRVFQTMSLAAVGPGGGAEFQLPVEVENPALPGAGSLPELEAAERQESSTTLPAAESGGHDETFSLDATDEQIERDLMKEANLIDLGSRKYAMMKKKIIEKAKKDPEMVSQLLRTLLRDKV
jgi:flagellar M-ring protein FliF